MPEPIRYIPSAALLWLRPEQDARWCWDVTGEAIVWFDGSTLLFREELVQMLLQLVPDRVPKLGLIALIIAACQGKFREHPGLATLASLPQDLRSGLQAKVNLIQFLTEKAHTVSNAQAEQVLEFLQSSSPLLRIDGSGEPNLLKSHIKSIEPQLARVTPELLRTRLQTGMDALPEEPEAPFAWDSVHILSLLTELQDDPELHGLARLVRDFMATITLPRPQVRPDFSALGGVADLSNRGPIHRLLMSELANDDDVLTLRLALNEALYLKNAPPISQPQTDLVLIYDLGVRMWGIPRLMAIAAGLALMSKTSQQQASQAWRYRLPPNRSGLGSLELIDLASKASLVTSLSHLEVNVHPGAALELWAELAKTSPLKALRELVLLTHEETWSDPDFKKTLSDYLASQSNHAFYVLTFNRDGQATLRSVNSSGTLTLQSARINLEPLFPKESPSLRSPDANLPAFIRTSPPPLLLPAPSNFNSRLYLTAMEGYCIGVTESGKLWHWDSPNHGAIPATMPALPGSVAHTAYIQSSSSILIISYNAGNNSLHVAIWSRPRHYSAEAFTAFDIEELPSAPFHYFERYNLLYVIYQRHIEVHNLNTTQRLAREPLSKNFQWIGNGFFRLTSEEDVQTIVSVFWTGQHLQFEPIPLKCPASDVLLAFHRLGSEGPWYLDRFGNVCQTCHPFFSTTVDLATDGIPEVSATGNEIWLPQPRRGGNVVLLNTTSKTVSQYVPSRYAWLLKISAPAHTVRTRLTHIVPDSRGNIILVSDRGKAVRIEFESRRKGFVLAPYNRELGDLTQMREFATPVKTPDGSDFQLLAADWPEAGARAILDNRGMLHLQTTDRNIPEVTFILSEISILPIWASDGTRLGSPFFLGRDINPIGDVHRIDDYIRLFCALVL